MAAGVKGSINKLSTLSFRVAAVKTKTHPNRIINMTEKANKINKFPISFTMELLNVEWVGSI